MTFVQVVKVHYDDPPHAYYTILLNEGTEKQTTADSLIEETPLSSFSVSMTSFFFDIGSAVECSLKKFGLNPCLDILPSSNHCLDVLPSVTALPGQNLNVNALFFRFSSPHFVDQLFCQIFESCAQSVSGIADFCSKALLCEIVSNTPSDVESTSLKKGIQLPGCVDACWSYVSRCPDFNIEVNKSGLIFKFILVLFS
jgi:hypothetical protein